MLFQSKSRASGLSALLFLGFAIMQGPAYAGDTFYAGRAIGVEGTLKTLTATEEVLLVANYMSCQGIARDETAVTVNHPAPLAVHLRDVTTYTLGMAGVSTTSAALGQVEIDLPGLSVSASAIDAVAEARCTSPRDYAVSGRSTIGSLTINGQTRSLSGEPNQTFEIPGVGKVIANEQVQLKREFRVNGLRVIVGEPSAPVHGDIVVSHVRARITCK
jgi:hypothetical protein